MRRESISDQKRLVRGEHWIAARRILRARDHVHHHQWRILIIAGPSPHEEIACIKELMPKAHITAIDVDETNVLSAKVAGADTSFICNVFDFQQTQTPNSKTIKPPASLKDNKYDVCCLDLTGPANDALYRLISIYFAHATANGGILITTFSYGRDVMEAYHHNWQVEKAKDNHQFAHWRALATIDEMPEEVMVRVFFALRSRSSNLQSCLQYLGAHMPMISCLLVKKTRLPKATFCRILPDDFELAVTSENIGNIYACPSERIALLRRSMAAKKAVQTRKLKQLALALSPPSGGKSVENGNVTIRNADGSLIS